MRLENIKARDLKATMPRVRALSEKNVKSGFHGLTLNLSEDKNSATRRFVEGQRANGRIDKAQKQQSHLTRH